MEKYRIDKEWQKPRNIFQTIGEKPISRVYPVIDTDLARDNIENHIPEADLQDL